jgi:hypothetical protein
MNVDEKDVGVNIVINDVDNKKYVDTKEERKSEDVGTKKRPRYVVDIDFDEASEAWRANKRNPGMSRTVFEYCCGAKKPNGEYCKAPPHHWKKSVIKTRKNAGERMHRRRSGARRGVDRQNMGLLY